jgi:hypothetical protein
VRQLGQARQVAASHSATADDGQLNRIIHANECSPRAKCETAGPVTRLIRYIRKE